LAKKKALTVPLNVRREWISAGQDLSIVCQCAIAGLNRSTHYYEPATESAENMILMRLIDEIYTKHPFLGSRRVAALLRDDGHAVNRKRIQRLMNLLGIEAIYAKPRTTVANKQHQKFPYLLRDVVIKRPNHVWSTDITYIRVQRGFMYLTAVIDWYSRYVLSWELSNTLDGDFCLRALDAALMQGRPEIFNTDQGCQFTAEAFTTRLHHAGVKISMDGKGRAFDNIFVERLWRTVKYEEVYIKDYNNGDEAHHGLDNYLTFYNNERPHQALGYKTPRHVHVSATTVGGSPLN
jgi:putative transposase